MTSVDCDVIVVGCGLTGASAAWWLTSRGRSVMVLEQFDVGHDRGSSHGTSRIYRRAYPDPFYVTLTGFANEHWQRLEHLSGRELRTRTGEIDSGRARDPASLVTLLRGHGIRAELLTPQEATERWPGMRFAGPVMFHPDAGHLDADATVRAMLDLAVAAGAQLYEQTPMIHIERIPGGIAVHTERRTIRAQQVVLCTGPWLPELLPDLLTGPAAGIQRPMVRLPELKVKQQEVFHFRHLDPSARWPTLVHKDDVQLYALASGADGGPVPAMKVAQFDSESSTSASTRDGIIDDRARRVVRGYVERWMPGLDPAPVAEDSCLFTMTADEDFVIDRIGDIILASPCSGHGAKFAPLLGELIADLVDGLPAHPRFAFR